MRIKFFIMTNNPLVAEKHSGQYSVVYSELSYEGLLQEVRKKIHEGHQLLTHPLSGSVKPNETPYKSVLLAEEKTAPDLLSLELIENAITACSKFSFQAEKFGPQVLDDFQLIDLTLIDSALESASMGH